MATDYTPLTQGIGQLITGVMTNKLSPLAMQGDQDALLRLGRMNPYAAQQIGGILENQQAKQAEEQARRQEIMGLVSRGYATATDKAGYLAAAGQQLAQAGFGDLSQQMMADAEQFATAPGEVSQRYNAMGSIYGAPQGQGPTASIQEIEYMRERLSPEEFEDYIRVRGGIQARATVAPEVYGQREREKLEARGELSPTIKRDEAREATLGKAEGERIVDAPRRAAALRSKLSSVDNVLATAQDAAGRVNVFTAGPGGKLLANFDGTKAADLRETIKTVKSAISRDTLQEMRDNSKTGGALGNVTERELDMLESSIASLNQSQSPEQLRRNLEKVIEHYNNFKELAIQASAAQEQSVGSTAVDFDLEYDPASGTFR